MWDKECDFFLLKNLERWLLGEQLHSDLLERFLTRFRVLSSLFVWFELSVCKPELSEQQWQFCLASRMALGWISVLPEQSWKRAVLEIFRLWKLCYLETKTDTPTLFLFLLWTGGPYVHSGSASPTRPPFAQSESWYPNPQSPVYHSGPVYSKHPGKFSVL